MRLSFVVPVYNVEAYIERCISSLLHQDINDYEIVIVNDGSKDRSIEIVRQKFSSEKIIIVEQENRGPSAARNLGISIARGEYLWFIDSDDYIEENCLASVLSSVEEKDLLIMKNGILEKESESLLSYPGVYDIDRITKAALLENFIPASPYYVIKKQLLLDNNVYFKHGVLHEDMEFMPRMIFVANTFCIYKKPLYHQSVRSGSITHSYNPKRAVDVLSNAETIFDFYKKHEQDPQSSMLLVSGGKCIVYGVILSMDMPKEEQAAYIKMISNNDKAMCVLKKSPALRHRIQGAILSFCPKFYIKLFVFFYKKKYA